jgi:hypothetical protein
MMQLAFEQAKERKLKRRWTGIKDRVGGWMVEEEAIVRRLVDYAGLLNTSMFTMHIREGRIPAV